MVERQGESYHQSRGYSKELGLLLVDTAEFVQLLFLPKYSSRTATWVKHVDIATIRKDVLRI